MMSNCGFLEEVGGGLACGVHRQPSQPKVCRDFTVGSWGCITVRGVASTDLPEVTVVLRSKLGM